MITPDQLIEMQERLKRNTREANAEAQPETQGISREISELHGPISKWLHDYHVPHYHARPDRASGITVGAPDYAIFIRGKVVLIECKTRTGKLSTEQVAWSAMAENHGFTVHVVRTFAAFLELMKPHLEARDWR